MSVRQLAIRLARPLSPSFFPFFRFEEFLSPSVAGKQVHASLPASLPQKIESFPPHPPFPKQLQMRLPFLSLFLFSFQLDSQVSPPFLLLAQRDTLARFFPLFPPCITVD